MKQLTDEVFAQVREVLEYNATYGRPGSRDVEVGKAILALAALDTAQPMQVNGMLVEALQAAEKLEHEALVALSEATYELKVGNTYTTATDTYKAHNDLIHRLDKILNSQYRDRKRTALTAAKQAQPECNCTLREKAVGDGCAVCNPERAADLLQPERAPSDDTEFFIGVCEGLDEMKRRDAAFEAVRKKLVKLPRYSFHLHNGNVLRVEEKIGNWIEFDMAHKLFDPVAVDASVMPKPPLPDHEIVTMYAECPNSDAEMIEFARAIEAAHGIKQGGQQ